MLFVAAVAVALIYLSWPVASAASASPSDTFTIGTALLVLGYFLYPVLALIASSLLVVASMLVIARVVERRRAWIGNRTPGTAADEAPSPPHIAP